MEVFAWGLANPIVTALIAQLITMPDFRHAYVELNIQATLTLADAFVLVQYLGLSKAATFIETIDPWRCAGDETRSSLGVKRYTQGAVDKAVYDGSKFSYWTVDGLTSYLLSPLLLPKGMRPGLIRISQAAPVIAPAQGASISEVIASTSPRLARASPGIILQFFSPPH